MSEHRTQQVAELLKQELSQLLLRSADFPEGTLVTIVRVKVTPDIRQARVFLSIMPFARRFVILEKLKHQAYDLQHELMDKLVMKFVPKISFFFDQSEEEAAKIEELIDEVVSRDQATQ
ncbi:30S ribosome-binding factor RbfA [Candidatus Uhrbacteria bacterium]|nr:30S ribosome-binding factor RbfA [Candidatus Uhrbacteria bacterium]